MRNRFLTLIACVLAVSVHSALGQQDNSNKQKLIEMKKSIEGLDWQSANFDALTPLERCRTLLLLNHALDELGAAALAEADLVGAYLDEKNLAAAYEADPPEAAPIARSFEDACKIAAAMLQGPMSKSPYASELSTVDANGLAAYEKLYGNTCRDKWEKFSESARALRSIVVFLKNNRKMKEYMSWAPTEINRRQAEFEQGTPAGPTEPATKAAAEAPRPQPAPTKPESPPSDPAQQRKERTDSRQAQQALYAAQLAVNNSTSDDDDGGWYSGWYYGAIDNLKRERVMHRDPQYQQQARARVEHRQQNAAKSAPSRSGGRRR